MFEDRCVSPSPSEGGDLELLDATGQISDDFDRLENLFHPAIPVDQTGENYHLLLPRNDHWLLATTSPRLRAVGRPFRAVKAGERIFAIGVAGNHTPQVTTCTVLDDAEARKAVERLKAAGDPEGEIPYDADAEGICKGRAVGGMSGGGVFGEDQKVVGTIVRGSELEKGTNIRFTRATFVVAQFRNGLSSASTSDRARAMRIFP